MVNNLNFKEKLVNAIDETNSYVCVGLDTDIKKIPEFLRSESDPIFKFNQEIINATKERAAAYKLNIAFYEAAGEKGIQSLQKTIDIIPSSSVIILDAKRGDIGNTSFHYATAAFDIMKADSVTVNPYMGYDSVEPFFRFEGKGVILLCLTSNAGSSDFQQLVMHDGRPLYMHVAEQISSWEKKHPGQVGMVVGATHPTELKEIRKVAPNVPLLIPGVGAQKGNLQETVAAGIGKEKAPATINSSRGIIYSSSGKDFAEAASLSCGKLADQINQAIADI